MGKNLYNLIEELTDFCKEKKQIFIYGAGKYGVKCKKLLDYMGISVEAFCVTEIGYGEPNVIEQIPVQKYSEELFCANSRDIGIIVAMAPGYYPEVISNIKRISFPVEYMLYFDAIPILEITTRIGCGVNCIFCPQETLIQKYVKAEGNNNISLSFETFKEYLEKVPPVTKVRFCGMCEPFLNADCTKMIEYAAQKGFEVDLYSTLEGLRFEDVDRVLENIESIIIHLADEEGNAKISVNADYKMKLKKILSYKRNEKTIVPILSCHGTVHSEIRDLLPENVQVSNEMQDRAGNLDVKDKNLLHWRRRGPIMCMCNDKNDNVLDCNILLPNGDVLLCCMDYALDYKIGSLVDQKYEEILNGQKIREIRESMIYGDTDIICRRCSLAKELFG